MAKEDDALKTADGGSSQSTASGCEELFKQNTPDTPPTQEELEKEKKREKREKLFAAIGDGISALSNLYFTTQYAPNMYTGKDTASQRTKDRWDKLRAERKESKRYYASGLMKARQADFAEAARAAAAERQAKLDEAAEKRKNAAEERAAAEEARKQELHPLEMRKAEGNALAAEAKGNYAEEYEQSRIGRNAAAAGASNAAASASMARAKSYASGGGSGEKYYTTFLGEKYKTQADYEKAVMSAAAEAGVETTRTEVLEYDILDNKKPSKQRTVKRSIADIAAELERLEAQKDRNKTMPGVKDRNKTMPGVKQ